MLTKIKFNNSSKSLFLATTRTRVDQYFADGNISKNGNWLLWFKTLLFLTGMISLYLAIILGSFRLFPYLGLSVLLGVFSAFVGFNVCHDAIHGAYSSNKTVNKFYGAFFHFLGANPYMWNLTHNVVHHTYTNIAGHDEDLDIAPGLIRLDDSSPVSAVHKYQHWYAFPLYGLASLSWVFRKDYKKFFQPKIGHIVSNHPKIEYFNLFFYKILYLFMFLVLPIFIMSITWWHVVLGFLVMHAAQGFTMGLIFQLAHVVEGTEFPLPDTEGNIEEVWAEHQMRTTANFSGNNVIAAFLLGGLNRQIEHHLFPKISHVHYGKIGAIVKQTAHEFNLPYIENESFVGALQSHLRILKQFGVDADAKEPMEMSSL